MRFAVFIIALFLIVAPARAETCNAKKYGMENCPNDIGHFLGNLDECNHWAGEEPYDDARRKEINEALKGLHCKELPCGYADLLHKYKGKEMPLRLIQDSLHEISGDDAATYASRCEQ